METYVYDANAAKHYRDLLSQNGGAPSMDRYIFNAQDGDGIGSFFSPLFKAIMPIVKKLGAGLIKSSIPIAKSAGREAIKGAAQYGVAQLADETIKSVTRKRKHKPSVKTRPYKRV